MYAFHRGKRGGGEVWKAKFLITSIENGYGILAFLVFFSFFLQKFDWQVAR